MSILNNIMHKHLKPIYSLLVLTALLILPYLVFAQNADPTNFNGQGDPNFNSSQSDPITTNVNSNSMLGRLNAVAGNGGYSISQANGGLMGVVGVVIQAALGLLGAIFIIIMIMAGYNWMTASGNEQKVEKAQAKIRQAIIGLIITISSWAIWTFILNSFILK
jgi:hypothetical protein